MPFWEFGEDALAGKYDILLIYMFDHRIGRRDDETVFVVEWLTRNGIAVWSVCIGGQQFDNHVDKLANYIRYWQAARESEKISKCTRTRIRQLTEAGFLPAEAAHTDMSWLEGGASTRRISP